MQRIPTDFYFLGERDYVHGPTILGTFLSLVDREDHSGTRSGSRVVACRLRRHVRMNGTVLRWETGEQAPNVDADRVLSSARVEKQGRVFGLVLMDEGARPILRRLPYDEDSYLVRAEADLEFGGRGYITKLATKKDVIRAIVALNKRIHGDAERAKFGELRYRWIFVSLEQLSLPALPSEDPGDIPPLKAAVWLRAASRMVGENLHSTSEGWLEVRGEPQVRFRIGFAGEPRQHS